MLYRCLLISAAASSSRWYGICHAFRNHRPCHCAANATLSWRGVTHSFIVNRPWQSHGMSHDKCRSPPAQYHAEVQRRGIIRKPLMSGNRCRRFTVSRKAAKAVAQLSAGNFVFPNIETCILICGAHALMTWGDNCSSLHYLRDNRSRKLAGSR